MSRPFCHIELHSTNPERSKEFYSALFEWPLVDVTMGPMQYTMIDTGDGPTAGLMATPAPGAPSAWLAFVEVPDVATATKKAASLGATVLRDRTEIPNRGWFSVIADPTGAAIGLVEHKK